jgi:hypothetical protein
MDIRHFYTILVIATLKTYNLFFVQNLSNQFKNSKDKGSPSTYLFAESHKNT